MYRPRLLNPRRPLLSRLRRSDTADVIACALAAWCAVFAFGSLALGVFHVVRLVIAHFH